MSTNTSGTGVTSNTSVAINDGTIHPAIATPAAVPGGKAKVAVGTYQRATVASLQVLSGFIVTGMTGNAAFATPNPTLADFTAARNDYIAAVNGAKGNTIGVAVRVQKRTALLALIRKLAHYVQVTSGGDLPTLLSSGLTAQRPRQPVGVLPAPLNLRLLRGKVTGQIIVRTNRHDQAGAYEWRYTTAANPTGWIRGDATLSASTTLYDLVPGTQYIVQGRAVGSAGPSNWSDGAMLMAA